MSHLAPLRKVAFVFFFTTGLGHFIGGLLFVNNIGGPYGGIISRILYIPFVFAAIFYGLSTASEHLLRHSPTVPRWISIVFFSLSIFAIGGLVAMEILLPDAVIK